MLIGRVFFFGFPGSPVAPMRQFGCYLNSEDSDAAASSFNKEECIAFNRTWEIVVQGCPEEQKWCFEEPALDKVLVSIGLAVGTIGYAYCVALLQTIYSKVLGPRPQVSCEAKQRAKGHHIYY